MSKIDETDSEFKPSFTPGRKWSIAFNVVIVVLVVLSVVVMVNYLSHDYFLRFQSSKATKVDLSSRTISIVKNLTNPVNIVVYYDREEPLYTTVIALLKEYRQLNPKITIQTIDFNRDFGAAQKIKTQYNLGSASDKNLVIFECNGKAQPIDGKALADYSVEPNPGGSKDNPYRIKTTAFKGEVMFTSALLKLTSLKPLKAYFLQGHGEHRIDNGDQRLGFMKFAAILQQNIVQVEPLNLLGTNSVPADCNLLVIAGPTAAIPDSQLSKIDQYLNQGGRLLALFNAETVDKLTGVEKILAGYGVAISDFIVADPDNSNGESDVTITAFTKHPAVNPLTGSGLFLVRPRGVGRLSSARVNQPGDAAKVEPLAYTGPRAYNESDPAKAIHQFPVMVAVEKGAIKGVVAERSTTRMLIAGDSMFLANGLIDSLANRDFAGYAVNWLVERPQLLEAGLGPKPLPEHRLLMTQNQLQTAEWILLGGMPCAVLLLGGMVWLRRRR